MIMTGKKVLLIGVAWFSVVLSVNSIFLARAIETHTGLVLENAYQMGIHYNKIHEDSEVQKEKGLIAKATFDNLPDGHVRLKLKGFEKGSSIFIRAVDVKLVRPLEPQKDRPIFAVCTENVCLSDALFLDKGQWEVQAVLKTNSGETIRLVERLNIP